MRHEVYQLNVPLSDTSGTAFPCANLREKWVQIGGTFSATVSVEISINGSDWELVGDTTAPAMIEVLPSAQSIRITVSSYVSGTPSAQLAGFNTRTQ